MNEHSQRAAAAWSLAGASAAAIMAVCVNHASRALDFRVVLLARSLVVLIAAAAIWRWATAARPRRLPRALWLRSGVGACAIVCNFYVVATLPVSDAIVLVNTAPLWIVLASWLWLGQRQRAATWLAALAAWAGVVLVARPHFADSTASVLLGLLSGVLLAVVGLLLSRLRALPGSLVVLHFSATSAALALALAFVPLGGGTAWAGIDLDAATLALVAGACVFALVNQLASTRAYQLGRASRVAVVALSQLVVAFAIDHAVEPRSIDPLSLLGLALVLGPTAFMLMSKREHRHSIVIAVPVDASAIASDERARIDQARARVAGVTSCRIEIELGGEPSEARAQARFAERGLDRCPRRDGVLVWAAPAAGRIVVIADEGIGDVVARGAIAGAFAATGRAGGWSADLEASIDALAAALALPFPLQYPAPHPEEHP
jgi:drug/metabolite transporter (DMT)-like permease